MSKSVVSNLWFARIDGSREELKTKCEELSRCIDVIDIIAAFHLGEKKENPHCHFVIRSSNSTQKQSFALRLKNLFSIPKKSSYALDVWDGCKTAGATGYLFHEDGDIIVNKGFSQEEIGAAKLANDAVQRVVAINKQKASNKLVEKLYEKFKLEKDPSRFDMLCYMLMEIKDGNSYHPGEFMLKRYVEEVEVRILSKEKLTEYAVCLASRLWKN